ncbi:Dipeptidase 2 [Platysternon megacephalum]|uniref:Dipeptidase 2 n=1 Tax=Platysternon megacephalum TaxID=55544 RepID=A0A4D9DIW0_9SAUR|nr:Dipeptidase 2 [Platysternon megacephalum]
MSVQRSVVRVQGGVCKVRQLTEIGGCLLLCWGPRAVVCTVVVHVIPGAPSVGQNITLSVEVGLEPLRHFDWYRGRLADGSTRIFSYFPGQERPQRNGVQFTGREVGFPNGSLLLRGAQGNDSGTYRVALQLVPQGSEKGTVELRVSDDTEPIYEVMELPQPEERNPETDPRAPPAIPLPPQPDPNYTELLQRAESVYAQIQR